MMTGYTHKTIMARYVAACMHTMYGTSYVHLCYILYSVQND